MRLSKEEEKLRQALFKVGREMAMSEQSLMLASAYLVRRERGGGNAWEKNSQNDWLTGGMKAKGGPGEKHSGGGSKGRETKSVPKGRRQADEGGGGRKKKIAGLSLSIRSKVAGQKRGENKLERTMSRQTE